MPWTASHHRGALRSPSPLSAGSPLTLSSCLAALPVCCVLKECPKHRVYTTRMRWRDNADTHVLLPITPVENKLSSPRSCLQTD